MKIQQPKMITFSAPPKKKLGLGQNADWTHEEVEPADGSDHPIHHQPGHEEVDPLKRMEANRGVLAKAAGGQHDNGGNPAHYGNVAKDGGGAGRDAIANR